MQIVKKVVIGLVVLILPLCAAVDLSISGNSTMEINSVYTLSIIMDASTPYSIKILQSQVTYNQNVFEKGTITINSKIDAKEWETKIAKSEYDPSTSNASLFFLRKNNNDENALNLPSGTTTMFTFTFRIKDNAPLGETYLGFIESQSMVGHEITGTLTGKTVAIVADTTRPITTCSLLDKHYYKTNPEISFSTNEQQRHATINYTILSSVEAPNNGSGKDPITSLTLFGRVNDVVEITVNYQAYDWEGNTENLKTSTCVIDLESPIISATSVMAHNPIAKNGIVTVNFSVYDKSNALESIQVNIGGHNYPVTLGACNNTPYTINKPILGDEGTNRSITITVTDKAKNSTNYTFPENESLIYKFAGAGFTIVASPNPLYAGEELTITVSASEELLGNPDVKVGVNAASFNFQILGTNIYNYSFTPSTNGFGAGFAWLGAKDETPPYTTDHKSIPNSIGNPINQVIHFRIADYQSDICLTALTIKLNDKEAITSGEIATGYKNKSRIKRIFEKSYDVFHVPDAGQPMGETVEVQITTTDTSPTPNPLGKTFEFTIDSVSVDTAKPTVKGTSPAPAATKVPIDAELIIQLDDDIAGVALDTIDLYVSNIFEDKNTSYSITQVLDRKVKAIAGGVVQPGFTASIIPDGTGGYIITVIPDAGFLSGADIAVSLSFSDLTLVGNNTEYGFDFNTLAAGDGTTTRIVKQPLAYPTIFDPDQQDTKLYFELKEPTDVIVKLYDLSGSLMWEKSYTAAVAGSHFVTWDGTSTWTSNMANGVYLFYITDSSKKVLGRGKVMIMRAARE